MSETVPFVRKEIDVRGRVCPSTLLVSLRWMNGMKEDLKAGTARLEILTDNRDSVGTISDAADRMGYAVAAEKEGSHYRLIVRRRE